MLFRLCYLVEHNDYSTSLKPQECLYPKFFFLCANNWKAHYLGDRTSHNTTQ